MEVFFAVGLYLLASVGLSLAITKERVFAWLRNMFVFLRDRTENTFLKKPFYELYYLFHCPICMGFWTGFLPALCLYIWKVDNGFFQIRHIMWVFALGFASLLLSSLFMSAKATAESVMSGIKKNEQYIDRKIDKTCHKCSEDEKKSKK